MQALVKKERISDTHTDNDTHLQAHSHLCKRTHASMGQYFSFMHASTYMHFHHFKKSWKLSKTKSQVAVWQVLPNSGQNVCTQHLYYNWCAHHDEQELVHYIKDLLHIQVCTITQVFSDNKEKVLVYLKRNFLYTWYEVGSTACI